MKTSTKLGAGASLTFLLSSLLTTGVAANAETVEGCGEIPDGAALIKTDKYCEIIFGSFPNPSQTGTWTVPQGVISLQALLVGGGAGANDGGGEDFASGWGYSGDGGKVSYADLTSTKAGTELFIRFGAGGLTDFAGNGASVVGGTSEILGPGGISLASALGGQGTGGAGVCTAPGVFNRGFLAVGIGAAAFDDGLEACEEFGSKGIVPAEDPNSTSLFKDLTLEALNGAALGNGGILSSSVPSVFGSGWGAWIKGSLDGSVTAAPSGASGSVSLRYVLEEVPVEEEEELADTGASEEQLSNLAKTAALIAGLGALMLIPARRRRNRA